MHTYRGKYPNRIESAWRVSDRYEDEAMRGKAVARTNDGRLFTVTIDRPGLLHSLHDLVLAKIDITENNLIAQRYVQAGPAKPAASVVFEFWMQSTIRR